MPVLLQSLHCRAGLLQSPHGVRTAAHGLLICISTPRERMPKVAPRRSWAITSGLATAAIDFKEDSTWNTPHPHAMQP